MYLLKGDFETMFSRLMSKLRVWQRALRQYYVNRLRRRIPTGMRRKIGRVYASYVFWRISPRATRRLGPRYQRSCDRIDIDITWDCNLRCFHCNRSCQQAPTEERMTVGQIRRFLDESLERNVRWQKIHLIGGEPTLHPQFDQILRMVMAHRDRHSPGTRILISSNGFGEHVNAVLNRIPAGVVVHNTRKTSRQQDEFIRFNLAPCDSPDYARADFRNGCCVTRDAGIGLTPYGFYPCVGAGGIDRIFGFDCGRKAIPEPGDDMYEDLTRFCPLCGFFRMNYTSEICDASVISPTWEHAYAKWREKPPILTRYGEASEIPAGPAPLIEGCPVICD